jgi:uncharacterized protein YeaO (DUF488 family)
MSVRVVRLGTPRARGEGLRLGTVRRPPRGVRKPDFAKRDYYDQWLPALAPSQPLVSRALAQPWTDARWKKFAKDYRREMSAPAPRQLIELLAQLSQQTNFSVGCYCEREDRCHRSVLRELLMENGAKVVK